MALKRKNITSRKLRPKSVVGLIQGISADDIPDLVPPLNDTASQGEEIDGIYPITNELDLINNLINK